MKPRWKKAEARQRHSVRRRRKLQVRWAALPGGILPAAQVAEVPLAIGSRSWWRRRRRSLSEGRWRRRDATQQLEALEASTTTAQTRDLGDLFEYKLQDHVTIRKNQSALVPILQARIDAEKVSVWNPSQSSVLRALWLDNTSALTFDGGSFNVLEGDAFAGEGLMDPIKPGEKRLLSYAADLGVLVDAKQKAENQRVTRVFIAHGMMTQSTQERQENTYTIRNRDASTRTVVIEHPARPGWKLTDDEKPAESSTSFHRFRLTVDSKKTETLTVKEYRPITNNYQLSNVTDDQIKFFAAQKMITAEIDQALRKVISQKNTIAAFDAEMASRRSKISGISEDQQRVRENMKALKGSVEEKALVARYVRELNEQEDRVQSLQHESSRLAAEARRSTKDVERHDRRPADGGNAVERTRGNADVETAASAVQPWRSQAASEARFTRGLLTA